MARAEQGCVSDLGNGWEQFETELVCPAPFRFYPCSRLNFA